MDRFGAIENFLKYFVSLYQENPNIEITDDTFYDALANYGLTEEEIKEKRVHDINSNIKDNFFASWINNFKDNPDLDVYYTLNQSRFLQFRNYDDGTAECYKLYLSFPEDRMYACVNALFQYIAHNKIKTFSKVADTLRSDSVVLRIVKKDDAKKVIDFVNNNEFISSACRPVNPFLMNAGNIGMAYDRWLSYNSVLSFMLANYFKQKRTAGTLEQVSLDNFREYVNQIYQVVFSDGVALENFIKEKFVANWINLMSNHMTKEEVLSNFKDILDLMILELDSTKEIGNYFQKVDAYMNYNHNKNNCLLIGKLLNDREYDNKKNMSASMAKDIVDDYIKYAIKKYGSVDGAFQYLDNYLNAENINAITRDKSVKYNEGFRELFHKYVTPSLLNAIVNNDLKEYMLILNNDSMDKDDNKSVDPHVIFENACRATLAKYGVNQLIKALNAGKNGNYSYFTNGGSNKYRDKLIKYVSQDLFNQYSLEFFEKINKYESNMKKNEKKDSDTSSRKVNASSGKKEVLIPILTAYDKKTINSDSLVTSRGLVFDKVQNNVALDNVMARSFDDMYSSMDDDLSYGKHLNDYDVKWPNFATFEAIDLPRQVIVNVKEQLASALNYDDLKDIETDSTVYSFIPSSSTIIATNDYVKCSKLDIVLDKEHVGMTPEKILEGFFDYSIPKGKVVIEDIDNNIHEKWIGHTKDVEIQELKKKLDRMEKMIKAYKDNYYQEFEDDHSKRKR